MKKLKLGLILGCIAGVIDLIIMLIQNLSWDANLSAFTFWIVAGFFISTTNLNLKGMLKGAVISLILLIPFAFIIGREKPITLIPIFIINIILGGLLGFFIDKFGT